MSAQFRRSLVVWLRSIAFLALALHAMAEFGLKADESSTISGIVVDSEGLPVATASVQIFSAQGRLVQATKTDSSCTFLLPELPQGSSLSLGSILEVSCGLLFGHDIFGKFGPTIYLEHHRRPTRT